MVFVCFCTSLIRPEIFQLAELQNSWNAGTWDLRTSKPEQPPWKANCKKLDVESPEISKPAGRNPELIFLKNLGNWLYHVITSYTVYV